MDFDMLGLSPRLIAALKTAGITDPTPIQAQAIPHAMNGRDVMGLAQTGTGKTAAFGLPLIQALSGVGAKPAPKSVSGLVLAPTRELARQISDQLRLFTKGSHLSIGLVVGGVSIGKQITQLSRGTDLLIATPGRLIDLLDRRAVSLAETRFLVLDEADQMLDMGFIHALRRIAPLLPQDRQTMLFSATMPKQMEELSKSFLTDPVRVQVAPPGKPIEKIIQSVRFVAQADKKAMLIDELSSHKGELALVFSRTKHGAEKLKKALEAEGFAAGSIHGNKSQGQRDRALDGFRAGDLKVLVATDVAARGIDIPDVAHVYNFDLPNVPENYVHRIGRTARAGRDGRAVAFCSAEEMGELRDIEKTLKREIPVTSGSPWEFVKPAGRGGRGGKPGGKPGGFKSGGKLGGGGGGARRRSGGGRRSMARAA
jgi:ATP-dependent RNA helicase RhlE